MLRYVVLDLTHLNVREKGDLAGRGINNGDEEKYMERNRFDRFLVDFLYGLTCAVLFCISHNSMSGSWEIWQVEE